MTEYSVFRPRQGDLPIFNTPNIGDATSGQDKNALKELSTGFCIEIGTLFGGSATAFLHGKADFLLCVDTFRGNKDTWPGLTSPDLALSVLNMRLEQFDRWRWAIWQIDSIGAAGLLRDDIADVIFIDGDHSEAAVEADIHAWWPKLKVGGVMCGHDYDCSPDADDGGGQLHPGVVRAVDRRFGTELVSRVGSCVWMVKKGAAS